MLKRLSLSFSFIDCNCFVHRDMKCVMDNRMLDYDHITESNKLGIRVKGNWREHIHREVISHFLCKIAFAIN